MRSRQTGMTAIGLMTIAAMVGLIGFAALKLTPVYLENMKIRQILEDVRAELEGQGPNPQSIRRSIDNRINIEMVQGLQARDFVIEKSEGGYRVAAIYSRSEPFLANISLLVEFDEEVEIRL
jgi:hypothetical protein